MIEIASVKKVYNIDKEASFNLSIFIKNISNSPRILSVLKKNRSSIAQIRF